MHPLIRTFVFTTIVPSCIRCICSSISVFICAWRQTKLVQGVNIYICTYVAPRICNTLHLASFDVLVSRFMTDRQHGIGRQRVMGKAAKAESDEETVPLSPFHSHPTCFPVDPCMASRRPFHCVQTFYSNAMIVDEG